MTSPVLTPSSLPARLWLGSDPDKGGVFHDKPPVEPGEMEWAITQHLHDNSRLLLKVLDLVLADKAGPAPDDTTLLAISQRIVTKISTARIGHSAGVRRSDVSAAVRFLLHLSRRYSLSIKGLRQWLTLVDHGGWSMRFTLSLLKAGPVGSQLPAPEGAGLLLWS